jgi:alcohol dehydrogenase
MIGFDFQAATRMVFGSGAVERLGEIAAQIPAQRALVVTDEGIVRAGLLQKALKSLSAAGIHREVYDLVRENPTTADVARCAEFARGRKLDLIIGFGGGSSLDTAKGANFLLTNGGRMQDYRGFGKATQPMLPMIAIPTTTGTGSEMQSYAVIADEETHLKMACGDPKAAARVAVLDPQLTVTQPDLVSACTGIDAVSHAVETAVTVKRNELSSMLSREAFRLTVHSFERALENPRNLAARGGMLLGAAYAGLAIENSMLGAAHAAANPLTARLGTIHGAAVGIMLPAVIRFNARDPQVAMLYRDHAVSAGIAPADVQPIEAVDRLVERIMELTERSVLTLKPARPDDQTIAAMAADASEQMTARFNPRPLAAADFEDLYRVSL